MVGSSGNVLVKKAVKLPSNRRRSTGSTEGLVAPLLSGRSPSGGAAASPKVRKEASDGIVKGFRRRLSDAFGFKSEGSDAKTVGSMVWSQDMLNDLMESKSKAKIEEFGGVGALTKGLGSSIKMGLSGADEPNRRARYGSNKIDRRDPPSYWDLFIEAMQDSTVLILLAAAFVSITLGIIVCAADLGQACPRKPIWQGPIDLGDETEGEAKCLDWLDGAAIIFACLLIGNITAYNESAKEKQFRVLQDKQQDCAVTVKRNGIEMRVQSVDVMVGDIVILDLGAKVPADGIFIKGNDLKVDESSLTGEADAVHKDESHPFLFSGCTVVEGDCCFVVTAVGPSSAWGQIMVELDDERDETPLQGKLTTLAEDIGKLGMLVAAVCFLAQLAVWFVINAKKTCFVAEMVDGELVPTPVEDCKLGYPGLDDEDTCVKYSKPRVWLTHYENFSFSKMQDLVGFFIDSVTIIVVAVPEGLPLAVTIALAYSVKKMQNDQNLVRVMAACETMGGATSICSDKTGTLTENIMCVVDGFLAGRAFDGNVPAGNRIGEAVMSILVDSIALNSKASLGADAKTGRPEIIGNRTEGALLMLLRTYRKDFSAVREAGNVIRQYPFSSVQKKMSTFVQLPDCARLYCKGASEILVAQCSKYLTETGDEEALTEELKKRVLQYISKMATKSLRTMALVMRDFATADELPPTDTPPEEGYTLVGVMGIQDPLRKEVPAAVKSCQAAGITVRMVTGDNILTAKAIAKEAGIYTDGKAIEGPEFRAMSESEQRAVCSRLQVMARCSPHDKLTLVQRLKEMGEVVAVTGDGTNDAPALKEADVGLSMGIAGTAVAQEASDMVILDDNFSSIVKAVMWGRSVYDNIRKFLQFQLTVNVVALLVCTFGAALGFGTPLKPVQLLWVNLIMDTFGALALATELPTADLLKRKPYGRNEALVNGHMWRNILVQSAYQLAVMIYLLLKGAEILTDCTDGGIAGNSTECTPLKPNGQGKNDMGNYRDTVIYNAFVWSQIFNEINARKIYNDKNVFSGIFGNSIYLTVIVLSCVVQTLSVQYGGQVFKTVPIDYDDWLLCLGIGAFSLILGVFMRFLPPAEIVVRLLKGPEKKEEGEEGGAARAATQGLNEQL